MWFRDGWRSTAPHAFAYLPSTVTISSCVQAITEGIYFRYTMQKCCVQHMPDIPKKKEVLFGSNYFACNHKSDIFSDRHYKNVAGHYILKVTNLASKKGGRSRLRRSVALRAKDNLPVFQSDRHDY